jgi:hypothetical protein
VEATAVTLHEVGGCAGDEGAGAAFFTGTGAIDVVAVADG